MHLRCVFIAKDDYQNLMRVVLSYFNLISIRYDVLFVSSLVRVLPAISHHLVVSGWHLFLFGQTLSRLRLLLFGQRWLHRLVSFDMILTMTALWIVVTRSDQSDLSLSISLLCPPSWPVIDPAVFWSPRTPPTLMFHRLSAVSGGGEGGRSAYDNTTPRRETEGAPAKEALKVQYH